VSTGAWLDIDLLRQRREQFGHQRPEIVPVRALLLRGSMIGAALPLLLLATALGFWVMQWHVAQRTTALTPLAQEHDQLRLRIDREQQALAALTRANEAMAQSMADVRSSSALLGELRTLVPASVRFDQAKIEGNRLDLDGTAAEPNGLRAINALMLALAGSSLFQPDGVTLKKAELQVQGTGGPDLKYSLGALFAADAPRAIRERLQALGADGLAVRLERLQAEGLLP